MFEDEAEAALKMKIKETNDVFDYTLKGYGEEPLARDHIILFCRARKTE